MLPLSALVLLTALDLPMPPPPPGMTLVAQAPATDAGLASAPDAGTAEAVAAEEPGDEARDETSLEMEELHALEEATIEPAKGSDASLRVLLSRLPPATLTRDRLEAALDAADGTGVELPFSLAPVTDPDAFDVSLVKDRYDIPVEMKPLVAQYIRFFQGPGRKWFRRWMSRSTRYIPLMQPILEARGLPRDLVYLSMIESGFNTQAKSWARAVGPWQFIAGTAKWFNLKEDFWIDERRDPIKATNAAAAYLALLHEELGHWYLAWAGYNAGGGKVRRLIKQYGSTDFWELSEGKGFRKETKHYVPKLIACALVARHPEAFGFSQDEFDYLPPLQWDEVQLTEAVDLEAIAEAADAPVEEIQNLNPELKRWCTPPTDKNAPYTLRIPRGSKDHFLATIESLKPTEKLNLKVHRVRKGDTLSRIARQHHSFQEAIMRMNGLTSAKLLRINMELVVPVPSSTALKAGKSDIALEKQLARARRSGLHASRPEEEVPAGTRTSTAAVGGSIKVEASAGKKKVTYGIARGDTLWAIARRFDVHVSEVREWNPQLGKSKGLKVGQAITIWPGPKAELPKK